MLSPSSFLRALLFAVALLLRFKGGKAQLFNYTAALTGWGSDGNFGLWPSRQARPLTPMWCLDVQGTLLAHLHVLEDLLSLTLIFRPFS